MLKIDCIVTQGDGLEINESQDIRGEKALQISLYEATTCDEEVTILIGKYEAEQIIQELKNQFDL